VHFTPGARTAWHTHPHGQTIFVTEGESGSPVTWGEHVTDEQYAATKAR
jgi:quercetin dioxygenase-like cupin family protein